MINSHFPYKKIFISTIILFFSIAETEAQSARTEILWDNYGVPHIYGATSGEMYYAFGWSQMRNHADLLLQLYGQARGRAAEYWGANYLNSDQQVHLFNLPEQAQKNYNKYKGEYKNYLDAFVRGINEYAKAHPTAIGKQLKQVLPITAADVLAHGARVIGLVFVAQDDIEGSLHILSPGSNAIAIAPSRSASRNAMLLTNPHLLWGDFFLFFEAHLNSPGFNAYGVSLIGQPVLNIAFNNNLGWTHTVNTIDASDRYELRLKDGGYVLDDSIQTFTKRTVNLKVRQRDGSIENTRVEFKYSKHGPVLGEKDGKAYAVRVAGLENAFLPVQYHKMAKARNIGEFESAVRMLQNPMFNIVYADKAGNILYLFGGNVPKRSEGDWNFWQGTIDGSQSKYIWNQIHTYNELPRLLNPSTGFVQNANDAPWTSTYPTILNRKDFPPYMSPQAMDLRAQRAVNMIKEDSSITFNKLVRYKLNTGSEAAERLLDDLFFAAEKYPDTAAAEAIALLKSWDKTTDAKSRGAVLFTNWFDKLDETMFLKVWDPNAPVTTPDGLKNLKQAVELLVKTAHEVKQKYGAIDVKWGDLNRFRINMIDYPANGGPGKYGIYRTMNFAEGQDKKRITVQGDTYVAVTEFGEKLRAEVLLSYGNASQPGSKHQGDQLKLLSEKKLRPALLEKAEVLKNLESREELLMK